MTDEEIDKDWQHIKNTIRSQANEISNKVDENDDNEKFRAIAQLMNIKDEMTQQICYGVIYRKMLLWRDLNITGSGQKDEVIVVPQSKFKLHLPGRNRGHQREDGKLPQDKEVHPHQRVLP